MANGNMGGIGRGAPPKAVNPQQLISPVTDVASKAAKAGKIRSLKLKIKMKPGK
jgi:hypothetical protein